MLGTKDFASPAHHLPAIWTDMGQHSPSFDSFQSGDCDCDCACPIMTNSVNDHIHVRKILNAIQNGIIREVQLDQSLHKHKVGPNIAILSTYGTQVVVLNPIVWGLVANLSRPQSIFSLRNQTSNWVVGSFEKILAALLATGVLVSSQYTLVQPPDRGNEHLTAWLHLTDQCNLTCSYCYVNKSGRRMNADTAQQAVQTIFRSAQTYDYNWVKLKYAGGEPTLNFNVLLVAQKRAELLSVQTGIALKSVMLTNGINLTNKQINALLKHNIQVAISLDGLNIYHDQQRPKVRGGGSFLYVEKTLNRLLSQGLRPHISITITQQNIAGLPNLVSYLLDQRLKFSFNFFREPNKYSLPQEDLSFTNEELINGIQQTLQIIEKNVPPYSLLSNLADRANLQTPHLYTCGVGRSYLVVDSQGDVAKCQMEMENPITSIGVMNPLAEIRADQDGIQPANIKNNKECQHCAWRFRCAGGCPRLTYQQKGSYDKKSPLCAVYRSIFPKLLQLEALRLLQYERPWGYPQC